MLYESVRGEPVPALGLGTWELTGQDCRRAVSEALEIGYRHLDTAQGYGNEGEIGAALRTTPTDRGELWITTKIGNRRHARDEVRASTTDSLRKLGTDYVDLLLIHWPVAFDRLGETLEAMTALHDEGKVGHLGVSNFSARQFLEAAGLARVVCNQVEFHPYVSQTDVLEAARKHDAVVTAYSPLARGEVMSDPTLRQVGQAHGKDPAQVALRWLVEQDRVLAVPKASSREHLQSNLDIFDFALTDADRERIDGLERGRRIIDPGKGFGTDWR